jgi:Flp pilus assembly protein TadD
MKPSKRRASPRPATPAGPRIGDWPPTRVFLIVLVATLVAYFPALRGDFLWDDAGHVTNPALQSWSGLFRIWFEVGTTQQYYPLLHSAFWIEHHLWGDAPLGYHLINVLWHATSACLFASLLRRLAIPGAVFAALLFALHPVCVESVAWISEQKNTLSLVFYLVAALVYLRFDVGRAPRYYALATLLFTCALLTKTVTASLPAALLVVFWWQRGRLNWGRDVVPLLPWFALGAAGGLFTAHFERALIGAAGAEFSLDAMDRLVLAGRVFWFYLGKLLWPVGLVFNYPRWNIDASVAWQWLFPAAALALLIALTWWSRRNRGPLAAALLFGGSLFPVLGFVDVYPFVFSYVADHFQYLASLGIFAFAAAVASRRFADSGWPRWSGPAVATGVLLILGGLSWRQSAIYRDVVSLYEATLTRNPSSWMAHLNLGTALDDAGHSAEGLPHLRRALELKPNFPETLNSLGNVLNRLGQPQEARLLLEEAVRIQPRFAAAHNTLGVTLMTLGDADAGMHAFQRALEIDPNLTLARVNLGWALANGGRVADAVAQFEQARHLQPDSADAEFKWGLTFAMHGRTAEAFPHFARAVELQPTDPNMRHALAHALLEVGREAEAAEEFEETLRLDPNHAGALNGLNRIRFRNQ